VVAWLSGNGVGRINEVILRQARLLLRWVTIRESAVLLFNHVFNQPLRQTQPPILCGTENHFRPRSSGSALRPGM